MQLDIHFLLLSAGGKTLKLRLSGVEPLTDGLEGHCSTTEL